MKKLVVGSLLFCGMMLSAVSAQTDSSLGKEISRVAVGINQDALIDQFGNPITKVDATRESFGEDAHGKYWHWDSDSSRGGWFYIDLERPLREEYTISMKFSYSDVNGSWKKILDYKNRANDDGFYFADNGHLIFYRGGNRGDKRQQFKNDEVLDLIVTRFPDGRFVVYSVKNGQLEKELEVMLSVNDTTFQEVNGKTRLWFFFDDNATSSEATRSGKFYSARVWEKAIDDEIVRDKLDEITKIETPQDNATTYEPRWEDKTIEKWSPLTPEDIITNETDLPPNTTFTFKDNPDTNTPGTRPVTVVVTYPDNSSEEVTVNITIPSDADKFSPAGKDKSILQNDPVNPKDVIQDPDSLPKGTKLSWKNTPDTSMVGNIPVTVIISYPDGSSEEVNATLMVNPKTSGNTGNPGTGMATPNNNKGGGWISPGMPTTPVTPVSPTPDTNPNPDPDIDSATSIDKEEIKPGDPEWLLPTQKDLVPAWRTKTGERVFTLTHRLTNYICPQIVQAFPHNKLLVDDIYNTPFIDDIDALMMYRGLEKDEMNLGQTYEEYRKHGVVLNVPKFEPYRNVTRAEFVKMLVRSLSCRYTFMGTNTGFSDVDEDRWYAEYITFAVKNGWINGYKDGTFRPNNPITRDEAAKILSRAIELQTSHQKNTSFTDVDGNSEFIPYIETLKEKGIMKGRTKEIFAPKDFIPRTETSRIVYRTFFGGKI